MGEAMQTVRFRRAGAARWVAPALLFAIVVGLAPLWWEVTAPPILLTARPWRDTAGTLLVPTAAVRPPGPGLNGRLVTAGTATVFVIQDGVARLTPVRLGVVGAEAVEIRDGLAEAALIVANPPRGLEDRHRVVARPQ